MRISTGGHVRQVAQQTLGNIFRGCMAGLCVFAYHRAGGRVRQPILAQGRMFGAGGAERFACVAMSP
eukprot:12383080-Alexandrium_andersonii.AAC.1